MKKLRAFTLMELLIGMIVTSIVVSFSYMSYQLIYKQFLNYKSVKTEIVGTAQLHATLSQDINNANRVKFSENKLILLNDGGDFEYIFADSLVLRSQKGVTDTFKFMPLNLIARYASNDKGSEELVSDFSFDAYVGEEMEHFQFVKSYDAQVFVNSHIQILKNN